MDQERKKTIKNYEAWLLSFERLAGKPVVVSLLVDKGRIEFVTCLDRKRYLDLIDDEGDDPSVELVALKHKDLNLKNYIG